MHLVATNLIVWFQGILKESVEEIMGHEKELQGESAVRQDSRKV